MNVRTTIILAVLVAIGGLVWLFTPAQAPPAQEQPVDELSKMTQVFESKPDPASIVRMAVEQPGRPRMVFERNGEKNETTGQPDDWRMLEPVVSATESWSVEGLSAVTANLKSKRHFKAGDKGVTIAEAGLDKPVVTLSLKDKSGKEYKLEVGGRAALSNDSYVRVAGADTIHQIEYDYPSNIKKDAGEYRAKALFKFSRTGVSRLSVETDGGKYEFAKSAAGDWVMEKPIRAYAVADKIRNLANHLASVRAEKYVDDAPASLEPFGLDKPYLTIAVTVEDKKLRPATQPATAPSGPPAEPEYETITTTHGLLVGGGTDSTASKRFIKFPDQPWVATATKEQIELLIPKIAELRDAKVTRLKPGSAIQLDVSTAAGERFELNRVDGQWKGAGDLENVDAEAVSTLLRTAEELTALDYVDQPESVGKYGLDTPRATVKVTPGGEVEPVTILVGGNTPSGRNTYVQVGGQPGIVVVSSEAASRLASGPMALRSRTLFETTPDAIQSIELTNASGKMRLKREGMNWKFEEPAGAPVDLAGIMELTNDLSRLRAKSVAGRDDFAKFGLSAPMLDIRFTVAAPDSNAGSGGAAVSQSQPTSGAPASQSQPTGSAPASQSQSVAAGSERLLRIGQADGRTYARRGEEPFIYELDETVFQVLTGELIRRQLFDIDPRGIESIRITSNNGSLEFVREGGNWKYPLDPSVPLVQKKISDFAADLAGLRAERYIKFSGEDAAAADGPDSITVAIAVKDKPGVTLKIAQVKPGEPPRRAVWVEQGRSFLLHAADVEKFIRGLDYYLKPEVAPPQPQDGGEDGMPMPRGMPPGMGQP